MNKKIDRDAYIQYKDKRFILTDEELKNLQEGTDYLKIYFVADKVNDFVVAGVKTYAYDSVKKKLVGGTIIMTVGLN